MTVSLPTTPLPRHLHIGGNQRVTGWEIFDANPAPHVDHVGNANDLSRFADHSFAIIYASHVVEHFDYVNELVMTLAEWNRVLTPGGELMISVPDLDVLAALILNKDQLNLEDRFMVMRMIFGGHIDAFDYHLVGLNQEFLEHFLTSAGFDNIRKVDDLGLFADTSSYRFHNVAISLNLIATKPVTQ